MKTNIGSYDAGIRFVGGCLIGLWGIHVESAWGWIGLVPALTGIFAFCPLYALLHISTTAQDR
jgi:hypothetical protein